MTLTPEQMKIYMREYRKRPKWTEYIAKYRSDRVKMRAIQKRYSNKLKETNYTEHIAQSRYKWARSKGIEKIKFEYEVLKLLLPKLKRKISEQGLSKDVLSKLRQS